MLLTSINYWRRCERITMDYAN